MNQNNHTGLLSLIRNYVACNLWANERIVEWLKPQVPELLEENVPSSFPSIKATLVHMLDTERFWLSVVQQAPPVFFRDEFTGRNEELFCGIVEQSKEFETYVNSLTEDLILENRYLDTPWVKGERPQFDFILHVINHSTYHRGQVTTIAHNVGIKGAPMTDYNAYLMMPKENINH